MPQRIPMARARTSRETGPQPPAGKKLVSDLDSAQLIDLDGATILETR